MAHIKGKEYYANLAIGPGIKFYQALCSLNHPIQKYELHIPDTYHVGTEVVLCFDEKKGFLTRAQQIPLSDFKQSLIAEAVKYESLHKKNESMMAIPAYIIRRRATLKSYNIIGVFSSCNSIGGNIVEKT